jgi:hypothetical protein
MFTKARMDKKMDLKVDFKKTLKSIYDPPIGGFHIVDVPEMNFLLLDGKGNPNTSRDYQAALEALYALSYGIKFAYKAQGYDHVVPPLEGLWWMEIMEEFTLANIESWNWTMMIMQPAWVTPAGVEQAKSEAYRKKRLPYINNVRFEVYREGLSVQILYIGAYKDEAATIADMHRYIESNGYRPNGKHHEVYLSDARKTPTDKLKTILRQPIQLV